MLEAIFAVLMLSTPAPGNSIPVEMGPGDLPLGTFCRIQDVCVIAQTETDCGKISGKTFATSNGGSMAWLSSVSARWILTAAIFFAPQTALADAGRVPIDPASIYVLAIGTCPPWRDKIKICAPSVAQFVETAEKVMGISPDRITTLID